MLLQLHLGSHTSEHKLLLAIPVHMSSENSLDTECAIHLLSGFILVEGLVDDLHRYVAAGPHLLHPVDGGQVEDAIHQELAGSDGLVHSLSEDMLVVSFSDVLRRFLLVDLKLLHPELPSQLFLSFDLDPIVLDLPLLLNPEYGLHSDSKFISGFAHEKASLDDFGVLFVDGAGLLLALVEHGLCLSHLEDLRLA